MEITRWHKIVRNSWKGLERRTKLTHVSLLTIHGHICLIIIKKYSSVTVVISIRRILDPTNFNWDDYNDANIFEGFAAHLTGIGGTLNADWTPRTEYRGMLRDDGTFNTDWRSVRRPEIVTMHPFSADAEVGPTVHADTGQVNVGTDLILSNQVDYFKNRPKWDKDLNP